MNCLLCSGCLQTDLFVVRWSCSSNVIAPPKSDSLLLLLHSFLLVTASSQSVKQSKLPERLYPIVPDADLGVCHSQKAIIIAVTDERARDAISAFLPSLPRSPDMPRMSQTLPPLQGILPPPSLLVPPFWQNTPAAFDKRLRQLPRKNGRGPIGHMPLRLAPPVNRTPLGGPRGGEKVRRTPSRAEPLR